MRVSSLRQFNELAADQPSLCSQRDEVAAALRSHQRRWDDADRAIGYTATRQQEATASADEEQLIARLFATEATSLRGLSAKLDVLIAVGAEGRQFPWPELRRIRRDVARLAASTQTQAHVDVFSAQLSCTKQGQQRADLALANWCRMEGRTGSRATRRSRACLRHR